MPSARPRGRPLSFNRNAALDRVLPVFWRKGFASASLDELASAAGLNRPNLAAAFGDKRGLYLAALERFRSEYVREASAALASAERVMECLDSFFDHAVSVYAIGGLGCFLFVTAPAASGDDPEIQTVLAEGLAIVRVALKEKLDASLSRELAPESDTEALAFALGGILLMLALHARAGTGAIELRTLHRTASRAILKGSMIS